MSDVILTNFFGATSFRLNLHKLQAGFTGPARRRLAVAALPLTHLSDQSLLLALWDQAANCSNLWAPSHPRRD